MDSAGMLLNLFDFSIEMAQTIFATPASYKSARRCVVNRLKELVHYICDRCKDEPEILGATKLNKVLWYVDTFAFLKLGRSLSGETKYVKQQYGPVPRGILNVLGKLQREEAILIQEKKLGRGIKRTYVVLKSADNSVFTADEKDLIDSITQTVCRRNAKEISDLSHNAVWEAAEDGEEIPLYAVLAKPDKITRDDKRWFQDVVIQRHS
jgi:hypothetical protein